MSFFPRHVLDEICDLIESVSEGFPTYSFIAGRPKAALGFLVILDVGCRYLSLFLLYINIKIGKNRC